MLKTKADVKDLRNLSEMKTNKIDMEHAMKSMEMMHKWQAITVVLVVEFMKLSI